MALTLDEIQLSGFGFILHICTIDITTWFYLAQSTAEEDLLSSENVIALLLLLANLPC